MRMRMRTIQSVLVPTAPVTQHPYYEQWRRYYEALAMQQQQIMNRQSMYGPNFQGFNPMMYFANPQMMQMQMQMPYFSTQ